MPQSNAGDRGATKASANWPRVWLACSPNINTSAVRTQSITLSVYEYLRRSFASHQQLARWQISRASGKEI